MIIDPIAQALHHKSALGGVLTPAEREQLEQWYAKNDEQELASFSHSLTHPPDLEQLRKRVAELTNSIVSTAQKIETVEAENERIRQEIEKLKKKLVDKQSHQPA